MNNSSDDTFPRPQGNEEQLASTENIGPPDLETIIVEVETILDQPAPPSTAISPKNDHRAVLEELGRRIHVHKKTVPTPPSTLGPFKIIRHMGSGGMGAVFESLHTKTGAKAAVKIVPSAQKQFVKALKTEVAGLARINAPNIIRVLDTGEERGFAWVALEWLDGVDLATLARNIVAVEDNSFHYSFETDDKLKLETNPAPSRRTSQVIRGVPIKTTIRWFRDLARALNAMHESGLVHRDVNPRNIVIANSCVPYLIDFGLAVDADSVDDIRGHLAGTIPYMSPEQARLGWNGLTKASDIYSLAISFHEFLTGKRVVRGNSFASLDEVAFEEVPLLSDADNKLPKSLDPIFRHATSKHPAQRYRSAADLAEDLGQWLEGQIPIHAPMTRAEKLRGVCKLHRSKLYALGFIALVATIWIGTWYSRSGGEEKRRDRAIQAKLEESRRAATEGQSLLAFEKILDAMALGAQHDDLTEIDYKLVEEESEKQTDFFFGILTFPIKSKNVVTTRRRYVGFANRLLGLGFNEQSLHIRIILDHLITRNFREARQAFETAKLAEGQRRTDLRRLLVLEAVIDYAGKNPRLGEEKWGALRGPAGYRDEEEEIALYTWGKYITFRESFKGGAKIPRDAPELLKMLADLTPFAKKDVAKDLTRQLHLSILLDLRRLREFTVSYLKFDARSLSGNEALDGAIDVNRRALNALKEFVQSMELSKASSQIIDGPALELLGDFVRLAELQAAIMIHADRATRYGKSLIVNDAGIYDWFADRLMFVTARNEPWRELLQWFLTLSNAVERRPPCTNNVIESLTRISNNTVIEADTLKNRRLVSEVKERYPFALADKIEQLRPPWNDEFLGADNEKTSRNYERLFGRIAWTYLNSLGRDSSPADLNRVLKYCQLVVSSESVRRKGKLRGDTAVLVVAAEVELALRTPIGSLERRKTATAIDEFLETHLDSKYDVQPYCEGRKKALRKARQYGANK